MGQGQKEKEGLRRGVTNFKMAAGYMKRQLEVGREEAAVEEEESRVSKFALSGGNPGDHSGRILWERPQYQRRLDERRGGKRKENLLRKPEKKEVA